MGYVAVPTRVTGELIDAADYNQDVGANMAYFKNAPTFDGTPIFNAGLQVAVGLLDLVAGQIKFPATQVSSTNPNTFDDYEWGDWTPVDASGAGLTLANVVGKYVKKGRDVHVQAQWDWPSTANGSAAAIGGLPFTSAGICGLAIGFSNYAGTTYTYVQNASAAMVFSTLVGVPLINSDLTTRTVYIGGCYRAAA